MKFLKYPSLTNHFAVQGNKTLKKTMNELYYSTEKLDGANINVTIDLDSIEYKFGKRSDFLTNEEMLATPSEPGADYKIPFNAIATLINKGTIENMAWDINRLGITYLGEKPKYAHVYGELFGQQISGQDYKNSGELGAVSARLNDILLTFESSEDVFYQLSLLELQNVIPVPLEMRLLNVGPLADLMKTEPNDLSIYGGYNEGYVFKKVMGGIHNVNDGSFPVVKYKTMRYAEVHYSPEALAIRIDTETINGLSEAVNNYITAPRLNNILSHGEISAKTENVGKLIEAMKADIKKEFIAENDLTEKGLQHLDQLLKAKTGEIAKLIKSKLN